MKSLQLAVSLLALAAGRALAADEVFTLTSADLPEGQPIPERHSANAFGCHGPNESPQLHWSHAPSGTKSFAVTMFDPTRPPDSGWWHWIVYDLPASTSTLARKAGDPGSPEMPPGARQAPPDGEAPQARYYGPCPGAGEPPHPYTITVYALGVAQLHVPPTATLGEIDYAIITKSLAHATIVRFYSRPKKAP